MNITLADAMGYIAALLVFMTFWMKTMVPLRLAGLASNVFFIAYGGLLMAYPVLILHVLLLPLNVLRLREMLLLTKRVGEAAAGDHDMTWIKPYTSVRHMQAGDVLFRKGDTADRLFIVVSGRCRLRDSNIEITPSTVVGELALLAPDKTRTQSLHCEESGDLLEITYGQIKQLYYQNPKFGFYFLELTSRRLFDNVARLEGEITQLRGRLAASVDEAFAHRS
ncbi:MAG TPA: cyclic nucleotide-binding domain-containing protein [Xanthobacteraceae bacterium]|nr:cyclic nucleotide-binding domain-containing protein [Xanthobacteraceae bacterium]